MVLISALVKLLIIAQKLEYSEEKLHIIGAVSHPSAGVGKNGTINSIEDAVSALSACLEKAERLVGVPIDSVYLAYNHAKTQYERVKGLLLLVKMMERLIKMILIEPLNQPALSSF